MSDCVSEWDDNDILRQVLAQSQQEYLDSLKRKAKEINNESSNEKASSSGLNNYYHESFRESCSSGLSGSPSKKLKVNDSSAEQSSDQPNEPVNETADKPDKSSEKIVETSVDDKEANDNDEQLTRHPAETEAQSEEAQCDKVAGEPDESIKSESSKSTISQDESSKH